MMHQPRHTIDDGKVPENELLYNLILSISFKLPIDDGKVPENWLLSKYNVVNFVDLPIDDGSVPENELFLSLMCVMNGNLSTNKYCNTLPHNLFACKSK